jgi:hypothetical protein
MRIISGTYPLCQAQDESTGLSFHQWFNIGSACFEVKTTMFFTFCVGIVRSRTKAMELVSLVSGCHIRNGLIDERFWICWNAVT